MQATVNITIDTTKLLKGGMPDKHTWDGRVEKGATGTVFRLTKDWVGIRLEDERDVTIRREFVTVTEA